MSLSVRQLMSYSPCKKENGRKRRAEGEERERMSQRTNEGRNERTDGQRTANGSRLLIGTSQLPAASQLAYTRISHVPFHPPFLLRPLLALARSPATFFFRHFRASRFTSAASHLDTPPKCIRSGENGDNEGRARARC